MPEEKLIFMVEQVFLVNARSRGALMGGRGPSGQRRTGGLNCSRLALQYKFLFYSPRWQTASDAPFHIRFATSAPFSPFKFGFLLP